MTYQVKLFAKARDLAGGTTVSVVLPDRSTVAELRRRLCTACPALAPIASGLLIAVDSQYAHDATALPAQAEIACFPPVSGG